MDWSGKAEALGALIQKPLLHPRVVELLETENSAVGVACSGGLDSLAALLLTFAHFPNLRSRLTVLHFNHLLRGKASDGDAAFVQEVAEGLGLPNRIGAWKDRDSEKSVSEAAAREARHAFIDVYVISNGGGLIVTGHQQGDILESLMLRIARASNVAGLSAPKPVSRFSNGKTIVRPLLNVSKDSLRSSMSSAEIPWREDASNEESEFDRNRLRNEVIPSWKKATQFNLDQAAAQIRDYMEEADEVIDHSLASSEYPPASGNPVQLPVGSGPRGVLRRWLYLWLQAQNISRSVSPSVVNEVLDNLKSGGQSQWSVGEGFLRVENSSLFYQNEPVEPTIWGDPIALTPGEEVTLPTGAKLSTQAVTASEDLLESLKKGKYSEQATVLIDSDCLPNSSILVRRWTPGDRYQPLNAPGSRKLQDMFVDRKISRQERNSLPVVITSDSLILWCPGLPVNHNYRVTEKTKQILQLTYSSLH
ncbi:MAG: tRNA lysidine(34) synthetase TilS [Verrucomicrobia bacterium]|nr:tRNA lysidine(34) synthetase TilS [Verrucomicrobiota bacterium]